MTPSKYDSDSVTKAIKSSAKPIPKKETKLIHALLKGHSAKKRGGS